MSPPINLCAILTSQTATYCRPRSGPHLAHVDSTTLTSCRPTI